MVAPKDAPEDIPSVKGFAKGFFTTACITTPDIDRPAPTKIAINTRGKRIFHTISILELFNVSNVSARGKCVPRQ